MISSQSVIVEIEKDISELVLFEGTALIYDSTAEPEPEPDPTPEPEALE